MYTNARSMGNKQEELEATVQQQSCDVVAITETWWDDSQSWSTALDGYKLFRRDRKGRRGGGVARYIKKAFDAIGIETYEDGVEWLWPSEIAVVHIKGHQKPTTIEGKGNQLMDQAAKEAALDQNNPIKVQNLRDTSNKEKKVEQIFSEKEQKAIKELGMHQEENGEWPSEIAVVHIKGHQKPTTIEGKGNQLMDQAAKEAALDQNNPIKVQNLRDTSNKEKKVEQIFSEKEQKAIKELGMHQEENGEWIIRSTLQAGTQISKTFDEEKAEVMVVKSQEKEQKIAKKAYDQYQKNDPESQMDYGIRVPSNPLGLALEKDNLQLLLDALTETEKQLVVKVAGGLAEDACRITQRRIKDLFPLQDPHRDPNDVTEGNRDPQCTKEATQAFGQLKKALMSTPALGLPDASEGFLRIFGMEMIQENGTMGTDDLQVGSLLSLSTLLHVSIIYKWQSIETRKPNFYSNLTAAKSPKKIQHLEVFRPRCGVRANTEARERLGPCDPETFCEDVALSCPEAFSAPRTTGVAQKAPLVDEGNSSGPEESPSACGCPSNVVQCPEGWDLTKQGKSRHIILPEPRGSLTTMDRYEPFRLQLAESLHLQDSQWQTAMVSKEPGTWHMVETKFVVIGDCKFTPSDIMIAPGTITTDPERFVVWLRSENPPTFLPKGQIIAQAIPAVQGLPVAFVWLGLKSKPHQTYD
ncbi:hypothetical protein HGM15179_016281 [Zosterops borbonicus]|uniref:RNase H type-1 domain-containing protein n=1 Tax=Zosterops borbonicus TaxID=364589 RepID=A0A8K1G333_9PASS|nr:hypothetical protein HGM15179_016281 [Zosterops borbonicus]